MQKIDFHFNVPNRLRYACLVARTVYKRGLTLAMWSSETKKLTELDDRHAAETPIILSTQLPQLTGDVLVLLDDALPADWQKEFSRFSRIIDVVSTEPTELKLSRDRWRAYKAAGVELAAYDRRK